MDSQGHKLDPAFLSRLWQRYKTIRTEMTENTNATASSSVLYRLNLAYFTFFMVPKNLVMYFSVVKKGKLNFLKKVENSEFSAPLKVKNQIIKNF